MKSTFPILALCLVLATSAQAYVPKYDDNNRLTMLAADFDGDGDIDLFDATKAASVWLGQGCDLTSPCSAADTPPFDEKIDLGDFGTIAGFWDTCTDPTDPSCVHSPLTLYEPPGSKPVEGVQMFSGEYTLSVVDMHIPARGFAFSFARTYRSRTGGNTTMGNNWSHSYNIYLQGYGSKLLLHSGDGRRDLYWPQPDGSWACAGFFRKLTKEIDGSFTMSFAGRSVWRFYALEDLTRPGKLSSKADRNGNTMVFEYDGIGRLTIVHDTLDVSHNRDITFGYNGDNLLSTVTDFMGRQVGYEYYGVGDPNGLPGDLRSVTTPAVTNTQDFPIPSGHDYPSGKRTVYTYSTGFGEDKLNHNLLTITDPKGQRSLTNVYGTSPGDSDRVIHQTYGSLDGNIALTYMSETPSAANNYAVTRVVLNDAMGNVDEALYNNKNRVVINRRYTGRADPDLPTSINPDSNTPTNKLRATDPDFFETRYQWDDNLMLTMLNHPNGGWDVFDYDDGNIDPRSRGNLQQQCSYPGPIGGDQAEICRNYEYDPVANNGTNRVTRYTDPRGKVTFFDYDIDGNRIRMTRELDSDPNSVTEWQYNASGQVTQRILPDNGTSSRRDTYTYYSSPDPSHGYLKERTVDADNLSLTTAYEYDAAGNLRRVIDPNGHDTQFIVNQLNQRVRGTSRETSEGSGTRYERDYYYDLNNNLDHVDVQNVDDEGVVQANSHFTTSYLYDDVNRITRLTREISPTENAVNEYEYDSNANLTITRLPEASNDNDPNNVIRFEYDERNRKFRTIHAPGVSGPGGQSTTQFDYDANGRLTTLTQGIEADTSPAYPGDSSRVTTYTRDGFGRLVNTQDPMGNLSIRQYDASSNVINVRLYAEPNDIPGSVGNIRMSEVNRTYDDLNRLTRNETGFFDVFTELPIDDGMVITDFTYVPNGSVLSVTNDNDQAFLITYDTVNRILTATDAKGNSMAYTYTPTSRVATTIRTDRSDLGDPDETFTTTYSYDGLDRRIRTVNNAQNVTDRKYDSLSRITEVMDARRTSPSDPGNLTQFEYDGLGRLIHTERFLTDDGTGNGNAAGSIVTTRAFDDNSRTTSSTDGEGNVTSYEYDALNRLTRVLNADATETTLSYDTHGNRRHTTDTNGTVTTNRFDSNNRLTDVTVTPAAGVASDTLSETRVYDGLGRIVSAGNDNYTVTLTYDSLSNPVNETLDGETTSRTSSSLGNTLALKYPGKNKVDYTYDELNRTSTVTEGVTLLADYDYKGRRLERRRTGPAAAVTQTNFEWDTLGRTVRVVHTDTGTGDIEDIAYVWNQVSSLDTRTDNLSGRNVSYSHDSVSRLIQSVDSAGPDIDYELDDASNRTIVITDSVQGIYTMNSTTPDPADEQMNQYTTTPLDSREYDNNGNLITINSTPKNIKYDYRNRMVEYTDTSTNLRNTYSYGPLGRRIAKVVDADGVGQGPTVTRYFYDRNRVIEEQDQGDNTLATYLWGNSNTPLAMIRGGATYYYHRDALGNVKSLTDSAGAVVESYEYEDNGKVNIFNNQGVPMASSAIGNPYMYKGMQLDPETGFYNNGPRYFEPATGRFTSSGNPEANIWGWMSPAGQALGGIGHDFTGGPGFRPLGGYASEPVPEEEEAQPKGLAMMGSGFAGGSWWGGNIAGGPVGEEDEEVQIMPRELTMMMGSGFAGGPGFGPGFRPLGGYASQEDPEEEEAQPKGLAMMVMGGSGSGSGFGAPPSFGPGPRPLFRNIAGMDEEELYPPRSSSSSYGYAGPSSFGPGPRPLGGTFVTISRELF